MFKEKNLVHIPFVSFRALVSSAFALSIVLILTAAISSFFYFFQARDMALAQKTADGFAVQDFVYYLSAAKLFWKNNFPDPYTVDFQIAVMSSLFGSDVGMTMPLNALPTLLLLLSTLTSLTHVEAYSVWIGFSISIFITAILSLKSSLKIDFLRIHLRTLLPFLFFILFLTVSSAFFDSVRLGQTSILVSALLSLLVSQSAMVAIPYVSVQMVVCLVLLSIKPQFLALGVGLLLIDNRYRETLIGAVLLLFAGIVFTLIVGTNWIFSYYSLPKLFGSGNVSPLFSWAFDTDSMNIFKTAFQGSAIHNYRSVISWITLVLSYIVITLFGCLSTNKENVLNRLFSTNKESFQVLLIGSYLLFAPHSGFYEELLFLPIVAATLKANNQITENPLLSFLVMISLFLIINRSILGYLEVPMFYWWILKFCLIVGFYFMALKKRAYAVEPA